jgi:hypothetical protein
MKRLLLSAAFIVLNISTLSALELTKPSSDPLVPYTKIEIKPTFDLYIGAKSTIKKGYDFKDTDLSHPTKCYFLLSRILQNKLEMGIESEVTTKAGLNYLHAFWKTPQFEAQLFAPKSVSNKMFLSPRSLAVGIEIDKSDQVYSVSHKFLADGICKEDGKDLISRKISAYLRSGDENDKFEFGFSFTRSSHGSVPTIKKENGVKKKDFLKSVKDSFVGSDIVSCAQSYEHKTKKGVSLKICTIQEFGSVKSLDLKTITNNRDRERTYDFSSCAYTSPRKAYALGLSGVLGFNDTKLKAAISRTSVQEALKNFCMSCAIEQKFDEGYKVELSYFQSYDKQKPELIGTNESIYRSLALYLEKELRKEVCLYLGISAHRGYKVEGSREVNALGFFVGTKIVL